MIERKKFLLALSIIPQIILVRILATKPQLVEQYYSEGLYPFISKFSRFLFGWIPFSIGDIFYTILSFAVLRYLYLHGSNIFKRPKLFFTQLGISISIAYFIFNILWGLNYYRLPIYKKLNFDREYTQRELESFTNKLVASTNRLQLQLAKSPENAVVIPYSTQKIYDKTLESYNKAEKLIPAFKYQQSSLKSSSYSLFLSYMGYGGYINPFTNEAQVNYLVPKIRLPSISGHEVGHQLGYSSESDTNFIGLFVTASNPDPYFKYVANAHALSYCLSDLKKKDPKAFQAIYKELNSGVKKGYQELHKFWSTYENPAEPFFKSAFNLFLKANAQKEGIKSYNAVVGLLIGYDRTYNFSKL